jgi:predicted PurR-regulated permease PerM
LIVGEEQTLEAQWRRQVFFWIFAFVAFCAFLFVFRSILLPFIAGMALAYMLDPVADRLEAWGANRLLATALILIIFVLIFTIILLLLVPVLSSQLGAFINRLPGYVTGLQTQLAETQSIWLQRLIGEGADNIRTNLDQILREGAGWLTTLVGSIWSSGKALLDILGLFVITPIVAFYLLLDWDRMVAKLDNWVPVRQRETVRDLARQMDEAIAGFVRGQGSVCLILGTFYAVSLTAVGLNFGLLIGMIAGIISFVPFVGSIVGFVLAVGVALVQFWPDYFWIALVAGIFALGQFMEGNFLQPKLVGSSVGLHPVWLMFALSAFGVLLGITGLLIAVPVAAALGVLVRFALSRYLESPFYTGEGQQSVAKKTK